MSDLSEPSFAGLAPPRKAPGAGPVDIGASAFAWPSPRDTGYPLPTLLSRPEPAELEGPNGTITLCQLVGVHIDARQLLVVTPTSQKPLKLKLTQLRRLSLLKPLKPQGRLAEGQVRPLAGLKLLRIAFRDGHVLELRSLAPVELPIGFFTFTPLNPAGDLLRSFYPGPMVARIIASDLPRPPSPPPANRPVPVLTEAVPPLPPASARPAARSIARGDAAGDGRAEPQAGAGPGAAAKAPAATPLPAARESTAAAAPAADAPRPAQLAAQAIHSARSTPRRPEAAADGPAPGAGRGTTAAQAAAMPAAPAAAMPAAPAAATPAAPAAATPKAPAASAQGLGSAPVIATVRATRTPALPAARREAPSAQPAPPDAQPTRQVSGAFAPTVPTPLDEARTTAPLQPVPGGMLDLDLSLLGDEAPAPAAPPAPLPVPTRPAARTEPRPSPLPAPPAAAGLDLGLPPVDFVLDDVPGPAPLRPPSSKVSSTAATPAATPPAARPATVPAAPSRLAAPPAGDRSPLASLPPLTLEPMEPLPAAPAAAAAAAAVPAAARSSTPHGLSGSANGARPAAAGPGPGVGDAARARPPLPPPMTLSPAAPAAPALPASDSAPIPFTSATTGLPPQQPQLSLDEALARVRAEAAERARQATTAIPPRSAEQAKAAGPAERLGEKPSDKPGDKLGDKPGDKPGDRAADRTPGRGTERADAGDKAARAASGQPMSALLQIEQVTAPEQLLTAIEAQSKMPLVRIGEALMALGYIGEKQLGDALQAQSRDRTLPLGELLVRRGDVTRADLQTALARKMGYPIVDVASFPVQHEAALKLPVATARRLPALPLMLHNGRLIIAVEDPSARNMIDEIEFIAQCKAVPVLARAGMLQGAIEAVYLRLGQDTIDPGAELRLGGAAPETDLSADRLLANLELDSAEPTDEGPPIEQSDNSLVKLINTMILEAQQMGVSDIHVECPPSPQKVKVRFRRDGVLRPYLELPPSYRQAMVARLKIMCDLDISERRKPQDGKLSFSRFVQRAKLELRVATIPTANGLEDVVLRLLASARALPLDAMQLQPDTLAQFKAAIERPYGLVLCCGPTGSGKTTALHAALAHINTPERKIWTAEDPVEITQPGLRQVQVNPKIDWTFAKALRAFLRADPDVVMVGEVRDEETAQMAVEASLTGHLVLSTLHTNSAIETVTRLLDMGMDPFSFSDSLLAVLAQRLVRRFCRRCVQSMPVDEVEILPLLHEHLAAYGDEDLRPDEAETLAGWRQRFTTQGQWLHHHAPGCSHCGGSGFDGRVGLYELLNVSREMRHLIQQRAPMTQLQRQAMADGMRTLRQDGILKVLAGLTTIEEVRAISNL